MKNPNCEVTIGFETFSLTIKGEEKAMAIKKTLHEYKTEEERYALGFKMAAFMSDIVKFNKLLVSREKNLFIGRQYGILTMGGAMSGLYEIARCVKLNADSAVFEYPNGLNKFERKSVKYEDVYNLKECCEASIRNRPEYAASFKRYLDEDAQFLAKYREMGGKITA